jgi:hypothetical protein
MNALRHWLSLCNRRVSKFTVLDVKAIQTCGILTGIVLVKFVPSLLQLSTWWLLAVIVACAARPLYVLLAGADGHRSGLAVAAYARRHELGGRAAGCRSGKNVPRTILTAGHSRAAP